MKETKIRYLAFFFLGAALYPCIELIWRGRTHLSMAILGGLATISIVWVDGVLKKGLFLQKALISAVIITQLEFIFGVILNLHLKLGVWDYRNQAFHLAGQICPLFSFYWFLLALGFIVFLDLEKEYKYKKRKEKTGR